MMVWQHDLCRMIEWQHNLYMQREANSLNSCAPVWRQFSWPVEVSAVVIGILIAFV